MTNKVIKSLLNIINQAKKETNIGLCDVFTARLECLAKHIRTNYLAANEAAELLEQEAEKIQNDKHEINT